MTKHRGHAEFRKGLSLAPHEHLRGIGVGGEEAHLNTHTINVGNHDHAVLVFGTTPELRDRIVACVNACRDIPTELLAQWRIIDLLGDIQLGEIKAASSPESARPAIPEGKHLFEVCFTRDTEESGIVSVVAETPEEAKQLASPDDVKTWIVGEHAGKARVYAVLDEDGEVVLDLG